MDDLLPQTVRPASFAYLLAFAFTGAAAFVWVTVPSLAELVCPLACVATVLAPLVAAMRGASLGVSYAVTSAFATAAFAAETLNRNSSTSYDFSSPFKVALMAFMALTVGGCFGGLAELLAWPHKAHIRKARCDGLQRVVPRECILVVFVCFGLFMLVCCDTPVRDQARFTREAVTLIALMGAATLVSFTWELRLRLRVRAILAGRVPGWRAVELPDGTLHAAPTLRWLDDLGCVAPFWALRHGRDRAIVREDAPPTGAYRTQPHVSEPYVVVPPRVSLTCLHSVLCAAFFLAAINAFSVYDEMREEFAARPSVAE